MDLYQGVYWEDEGGNKIRISDMASRHAYNCTRWLERNAAAIAFVDSGRWIGLNSWVNGEQAAHDLDCAMEQDLAEKEDPVKWIKSTPIWQALDRRAKEGPPSVAEMFAGADDVS